MPSFSTIRMFTDYLLAKNSFKLLNLKMNYTFLSYKKTTATNMPTFSEKSLWPPAKDAPSRYFQNTHTHPSR